MSADEGDSPERDEVPEDDPQTTASQFYVSWIPTAKTSLPRKEDFHKQGKTASEDNADDMEGDLGLIRPVSSDAAGPVRHGFRNYQKRFNAEYPLYVLPYIETSKDAINDFKKCKAEFWVKATACWYSDIKYLIIDGATRRLVCMEEEFKIQKMATNWLDPRISFQELVHILILY